MAGLDRENFPKHFALFHDDNWFVHGTVAVVKCFVCLTSTSSGTTSQRET